MTEKCYVTVSASPDNEERGSSIKLQAGACEWNIHLERGELLRLSEVRQARWSDRKSLRLGQAAGSSVFWSTDDSMLSILVGHDDETWDFGVMLPLAVLDEILEEVARART